MKIYQSWSGGKDSTASIILEHMHGLPQYIEEREPSTIVFSEVMFDKKRNISGELPEHINFIMQIAKPLFESWGHRVEIVRSEKDYLDIFYHVVKKSKQPERNGKYSGFVLGGRCAVNRDIKVKVIKQYYENCGTEDYLQVVGIAMDEPKRLERIQSTDKLSLLNYYGYTEQMAYDLCKKYGLLSPIYEFTDRGGCWFCPNQVYKEFAHLKQYHPDLWKELHKLSMEENTVSQGFKWGETFDYVESKVDEILRCEGG